MNRDDLWKIWKQLNQNRALEISTLWQRSVFLSAFIALLLTGSGIFFHCSVLSLQCPIGALPLKVCLTGMSLGCLLSIGGFLWVAMSKGSKYWFEVYEKKIDLIENLLDFKEKFAQYRYLEETYQGDNPKIEDGGEKHPKNGDPLVSDLKIMGGAAYNYSPSKINIWIGWLILAIGAVYFFVFFQICLIKSGLAFELKMWLQNIVPWLLLGLLFLSLLSFHFLLKHKIAKSKK